MGCASESSGEWEVGRDFESVRVVWDPGPLLRLDSHRLHSKGRCGDDRPVRALLHRPTRTPRSRTPGRDTPFTRIVYTSLHGGYFFMTVRQVHLKFCCTLSVQLWSLNQIFNSSMTLCREEECRVSNFDALENCGLSGSVRTRLAKSGYVPWEQSVCLACPSAPARSSYGPDRRPVGPFPTRREGRNDRDT